VKNVWREARFRQRTTKSTQPGWHHMRKKKSPPSYQNPFNKQTREISSPSSTVHSELPHPKERSRFPDIGGEGTQPQHEKRPGKTQEGQHYPGKSTMCSDYVQPREIRAMCSERRGATKRCSVLICAVDYLPGTGWENYEI